MIDGPVSPSRQQTQTAGTAVAPPCSGTATPVPVSPPAARGCRSPPTAATVKVADQLTDPSSLLNFYRELIRPRRDTPVLRAGDYQPCAADPYLYAYHRHDPTDDVLIAANFSDSDRRYADPQLTARGDRLLSTAGPGGDEVELGPLHLRPLEATVIRLTSG